MARWSDLATWVGPTANRVPEVVITIACIGAAVLSVWLLRGR